MAKSQLKTRLAILRSILGPVAGGENRFANLIGRSRSWLKQASAGHIPLTEDVAIRISHETGVNKDWLLGEGDPSKPVDSIPNFSKNAKALLTPEPYTKKEYDRRRAELVGGGGLVELEGDLAGFEAIDCFVSIAMDLANALHQKKAPMAIHRLNEFAGLIEKEFGQYTPGGKDAKKVIARAEDILSGALQWVKEFEGQARRSTSKTKRPPLPSSPVRGSAGKAS